MKTVVHGLSREHYGILVETVIDQLVGQNDFKSSLVPEIILKHFDDLLQPDKIRVIRRLKSKIKLIDITEQDSGPDKKYWEELLEKLEAKKPNALFTLKRHLTAERHF